ncbi:MAG TPA: Rieske 2Fe-2S domain-containing protein [Streptomyces sp.]|nr:Rieske 2Fe-2S domain-containing protein [Streptomyces sp.]
MMEPTSVDTGTGYGRKRPSYDARLTEVGPGTPMGEAMRRYWHPVATSANLTSEAPHRTRVLGEDLIVFRDGQGRAGVVYERCAHRGSSLFYGRIEDDGIRCCYHGWKFDVQGHCLEQACEPGGGRRREVARQPWYPVEERYGLVFAYLGPPDRKPALPRFDALDPAEEGDQYWAGWPVPGAEVTGMEQDFNWLQIWENAIDSAHVTWLHYAHSGPQLTGTGTAEGLPESFYDPARHAQTTTYHKTEFGAKYHQRYEVTGPDGQPAELEWRLEQQLPNVIALPDFTEVTPDARHNLLIWIVPSDDTHHRVFFSIRSADAGRMQRLVFGIKQNGKMFWEMAEDDLRTYPSDIEAQGSQGPITLHSEETLATTDRGVVMVRRMLRTMVDDVEAGKDPVGVSLVDGPPRHIDSGVYTVPADPGAARQDGTAPSASATPKPAATASEA